ncbi:MAG: NAD-dependent epimerase/dehydratase family protein [Patescibacteria group bacterium]
MSKVLVTGGAGFIGSHIVDLFIKNSYQVVVVDNLKTGKKENLNPNAKFFENDICDAVALENIFKEERPDFVSHQAAHASVRESVEDPQFDAQNNIFGSLNILENCVKFGVKKIVFASTGGALYGEADQIPTPENYPAHPLSPYGVAKLTIENYLFYYGIIKNLNYVVLRYANVYGERQDPFGEAGVVAIFSQKIISGSQPVINGDGNQTRDYVYVGDVAQANLLALESNKTKIAYNIGTGMETSVNELFKIMIEISEKKVKEVHGAAKEGEQRRSALDFTKIKNELGWKPKVALKEGLQKTCQWFLNKK